eukprot:COSAG01_NODE_1810_length_9181_cov_22.033142_3_plen_74_part_00
MSVFSIFCGTLYNEVFGIPVDYFESRWGYFGNNGTGGTMTYTGIDTCGSAEESQKAFCTLPPVCKFLLPIHSK